VTRERRPARHGQVRFELSTYALRAGLDCVVPWRIPEFCELTIDISAFMHRPPPALCCRLPTSVFISALQPHPPTHHPTLVIRTRRATPAADTKFQGRQDLLAYAKVSLNPNP